jgi:hypothetical protein
MLAIRCQDGTERLVCAPHPSSGSTCSNPNPSWAATQCDANGGFDAVLPYYSGCYPESVSSFWENYAPDADIAPDTEDICDVELSVPPLTPANMDFEDRDLGIDEWNRTAYGGDWLVRQKCDNRRRCAPLDRCIAYEGLCYALVNAGDARHEETEPQSLWRNDFRIPEVDSSGICGDDDDESAANVNFCFSFAMRFDAKDYASEGKDDRFTVKVQMNNDGPVLYERLFTVAGVGDLGDTGWMVVKVPLPHAKLGDATFFEFQATATNVGDRALDSVGYIDDIKIFDCTPRP